jgi:hypothetical protein
MSSTQIDRATEAAPAGGIFHHAGTEARLIGPAPFAPFRRPGRQRVAAAGGQDAGAGAMTMGIVARQRGRTAEELPS